MHANDKNRNAKGQDAKIMGLKFGLLGLQKLVRFFVESETLWIDRCDWKWDLQVRPRDKCFSMSS